jgi:drug/metabolite transporter (DMT)-like permease
MSTAKIMSLLAFGMLMAGGQILFKLAARDMPNPLTLGRMAEALLNVYLIVGIAIYAIATVLWVLILRDTDLSRAYLFVTLPLIIVPIIGLVFFGERLSISLLLGGALIVAGVVVISFER